MRYRLSAIEILYGIFFLPLAAGALITSTEAAEYYLKYDECHPDYFEFTPENLAQTNVVDSYLVQVADIAKKRPEEYKRLGEVGLYTKMATGVVKECDAVHENCGARPSCQDTAKHIKLHVNQNISTTQLMELTRTTHFTIQLLVDINTLFDTFRVSGSGIVRCKELINGLQSFSTTVQINVEGLSRSIIRDFTPQANPLSELMCVIDKKIVALVWILLDDAASTAASLSPIGQTFPVFTSMISFYIDSVKPVAEASVKIESTMREVKWSNTPGGHESKD